MSKTQLDNNELALQNERLQQRLLDAKLKVENLKVEKSGMEQKGRMKDGSSRQTLKESDQIIREMTTILQKREEELKYSMGESKKLLERTQQLENELLQKQGYIDKMLEIHKAEIDDSELRLKFTQDQAMSQLRQLRETQNVPV